jgi:photosystem II stability/assembly factor-like uncharacterized protein
MLRAKRPAALLRRTRLTVSQLEDRCTPTGVPTAWSAHGAGGGGSLFSPAFNPTNPSEIYVSSDMSQLFHTTDGGASWQDVDFRQMQGGHESRVQFTENPSIRYCLDYSTINGNDLVRTMKSTDGGQTWQPLPTDATNGNGAWYFIADPTNHNRLVVTDYSNVYFSADGGTTWATKYTDTTGAGIVLGGAFWDGSNVYLGTNDGLLVSTNGGSTFAVSSVGGLPAGQVILSFAGAKVGTTTRFLAVTAASGSVWGGVQGYDFGAGGENVATIDWGNASWSVRSLGNSTAWPLRAGMALNDLNTMYVAGSSDAGVPTVFKSSNGGSTWTSVLNTGSTQNVATGWSGYGGDRGWSYGQIAMGFEVDPADSTKAIITDYGFAHSTVDGGTTWQALYVNPADRNPVGSPTPTGHTYHDSGLDNTTSWSVAWADANHVIIGNSDVKAEYSADGGQKFGFGYTGDSYNSMFRVIKAGSGTLYAAVGSQHDLYQSTNLADGTLNGATGAVLFSTNQGATWQTLHSFGHEVAWVALDPNNSNVLYAAVVNSTTTIGGIWVTSNLSSGASSTWTELPTPTRTQGHPDTITVLNDGSVLASFSGRRTTTFTNSSGVFLYNPTTGTWADKSSSALDYWTKDVVVDPNDPTQNTWYAGVYGGWGGPAAGLGGLYKTTNRGTSWTLLTSGLDVESITFNPTAPTEAFMTTESQGLWYSSNMTASTPTFTQVASYSFRQPERVFFNPYNANEIWVTSFGGEVQVGTTAAAPTVAGVQVNDGSAQRSEVRSLAVTFSGPVTFAGGNANAAAAFQLNHVQTGDNVNLAASVSTNGSGQTVVTLTFLSTVVNTVNDTDPVSGSNGGQLSLNDGRYTLTIFSSAVTGTGGLALNGGGPSGNYVSPTDTQGGNGLHLYRLFGDVTGDGVVDLSDLTAFRNAYNTSIGNLAYLAYLDADNSGTIDLTDLTQFRNRYNASVY